jgi:DNA topoisomerase VI subunit A
MVIQIAFALCCLVKKPHVRNFKKIHQGKKSTTVVIVTDFDPLGSRFYRIFYKG